MGARVVGASLLRPAVEPCFHLSPAEIAIVTRPGNEMPLGLGLHVGFLRMSRRVPIPPTLSIGGFSPCSALSWRFALRALPRHGRCLRDVR